VAKQRIGRRFGTCCLGVSNLTDVFGPVNQSEGRAAVTAVRTWAPARPLPVTEATPPGSNMELSAAHRPRCSNDGWLRAIRPVEPRRAGRETTVPFAGGALHQGRRSRRASEHQPPPALAPAPEASSVLDALVRLGYRLTSTIPVRPDRTQPGGTTAAGGGQGEKAGWWCAPQPAEEKSKK